MIDFEAPRVDFADVIDALPDATVVFDVAGKFVMGNAKYRETFFDKDNLPVSGEPIIRVIRKIIDAGRLQGIDQMDPDHAALALLIEPYSFVQDAEFCTIDGRVFKASSTPIADGGFVVTIRDMGREQLGERRAAELLSDGFNTAELGMVMWGAGQTVEISNAAWQDLVSPTAYGDDVTKLFAQLCERRLLTTDRGISVDQFVRFNLAEAHTKSLQFALTHPDGRLVHISTFATTTGRVIATAIDISAQRDAQERARAMLSDAVETLEIGVMSFDADMKLQMMNRAAGRIILADRNPPPKGSHLSEIIGDLIDVGEIEGSVSANRDAAVDAFVSVIQNLTSGFRPHWKDGRTLEFSAARTKMGGVLVSVQDLTKVVNADRAAREANALVRTIVDANPTIFVVSKMETGEIIYSTSAMRERFGNITKTESYYLDRKDREKFVRALQLTGQLTDYSVRFKRADGSIMDGLASARIIEHKGEKLIVSSTRDISDYLAMQAELTEQREAAVQNEKLSALGELLAGVAHELSNPMSVILGYSLMLRDQITDAKAIRRVDRIAEAANRCAKILKMFLSMARRRPISIEPCDLGALLEDAIEISSSTLQANGTVLDVTIADGLPTIDADGDQIIQVIINLLINANQALEDKGDNGLLKVDAYRGPDETIRLDVADNGEGVPVELRHRIFEPFFTTKDVGIGTGVGLAFCHRTIAAHGGELSLEPSPLGGALFRATLPIGGKATKARQDDRITSSMERAGQSVLVLDDERAVTEMIGDVLQEAGYRVETFHNGVDAIRRCAEHTFDTVIADIRMPGMSGQDFFRILSKTSPDQADRLIFLTGDALNPDVAAFIKRSGRPHLEKPVVPDAIIREVSLSTGGVR